ncbi:MAG: UDP-3-O-(3-hydroxymyristoyl)glucosamine N-acyltransferase [Proteobacteria bacterium]|nr:UDP-3-O-(3-hydroxymyristoyl)glucosamine N-acyltransferase [Pseudomonadota bacterium]
MSTILTKTNKHTPEDCTLGFLAEKTNAMLHGDPNLKIQGVGTISQAKPGEITFVADLKYRKFISTTKASAIILSAQEFDAFPVSAALICKDPKVVYAKVVEILYPFLPIKTQIHPSAVVGASSEIHPDCYIGPNCVIGENVKIAANVVIGANTVIEDGCEIGESTVIKANVTIYHHCYIGSDCLIHSGVVIGSDGFGFANERGKWLKVAQIGGVKIGDRVEIGANTAIDRGAIEDTEIGSDVILDNLIQIAHNVKIGQGTAIAANCGIAGSAQIGKYCLIGGGTGIVGHIKIADYVSIVGGSNVGQSITEPNAYASGLTTTDMKTWKRNLVRFHQLDELATRLFALERKLKEA